MQDLVAEYQQYQDARCVSFLTLESFTHAECSVDEEAEYDGGEEPVEE
jgi:hypothetical protein